MKKEKKEFYIHILIIILVGLLLVFLSVGSSNIFGSNVDWISQHSVFPDYFRTLFYQTKDFFPDFALAIGGGQNIYNFGYYGLFQPVFLLSYFLPMIKMVDYIMISNILLYIATGITGYLFFKKHTKNNFHALVGSLLTMFAGPVLFHLHRHFMFVNYLPFLFLSLIGVDRYFEKNKRLLLIVSIFLMIMMSYYYSVGGLFAICLYAVSCYLQREKKVTLSSFFKEAVRFLIPFITGILLASILLLPTIYVILHSRGGEAASVSLLTLFKPDLSFNALLYGNYTIGLTSIALLALLRFPFIKDKKQWFLSIALILILILPVFQYLLNGALYLRAKVLIPFLPLLILLVIQLLDQLFTKKFPFKKYFILVVAASIIFFIGDISYWYFGELILFSAAIYLYYKFKTKIPFYIVLLLIPFNLVIVNSKIDTYVSKEKYNKIYKSNIVEDIKKIEEMDNSFYRFGNLIDPATNFNRVYTENFYMTSLYSSTYNDDYKNFSDEVFINARPQRNIFNTATTSNLLYSTFMNHKYIVAKDKQVPLGYTLVDKTENIYKNERVFPFIYVTNSFMNLNDFEKLDVPYRMEALLNSTILENINSSSNKNSSLEKWTDKYEIIEDDVSITKNKDKVTIVADNKKGFTLKLDEPIKNEVLILSFDLLNNQSCKMGDQLITIQGIGNKLTCKEWTYYNRNTTFSYVISSNEEINELKIEFSKGTYEIGNMMSYTLDYDKVKDLYLNLDEVVIDKNKSKGDYIVGNVTTNKDNAYVVTSLPYDESFTVLVDGKKQDYEKVNTAFVGFKVQKGTHEIKITYQAPLKKEGIILSSVALIMTLGIAVIDYRKNRRKKN